MSLTSNVVGGLVAVTDALPPNPYLTGAVTAATAGLVIAAGWTVSNPARIPGQATLSPGAPVYRTGGPGSPAVSVDVAAAAPLAVPLDTVPRDAAGRSPYDLVPAQTIRTAVDQFYSRLCSDPDTADFFTHVDMAALKRHQAQFIAQLWGGPVVMPLERLAQVHQGLQISPDRYWRVAGHLMATLTHLDVPDWICIFTMTRLYQARGLIIAADLTAAQPREDVPAAQPPDLAAAEPGDPGDDAPPAAGA